MNENGLADPFAESHTQIVSEIKLCCNLGWIAIGTWELRSPGFLSTRCAKAQSGDPGNWSPIRREENQSGAHFLQEQNKQSTDRET